VGLLNAAAWFGAAAFMVFGAEPAMYSQEVQGLLQKSFTYLSSLLGQAVRARFLYFSLACGGVAALHLAAEWLYQGRLSRKLSLRLLAGLVALSLLGGMGVQPQIRRAHVTSLLGPTPAARQTAGRSLRIWRVVGRSDDFLLMIGLAVYLWGVANPPETFRFVSTGKFRS
jgi:hypothetical protein